VPTIPTSAVKRAVAIVTVRPSRATTTASDG
jgi:hypothetical protein